MRELLVRDVFQHCFGTSDDDVFEAFCTHYFAGWLYTSLNGDWGLTSPIEPDYIGDKFSWYAEKNNITADWGEKLDEWMKEREVNDDTHYFRIDLPDVELVVFHNMLHRQDW